MAAASQGLRALFRAGVLRRCYGVSGQRETLRVQEIKVPTYYGGQHGTSQPEYLGTISGIVAPDALRPGATSQCAEYSAL
jgi:hypothetical protein